MADFRSAFQATRVIAMLTGFAGSPRATGTTSEALIAFSPFKPQANPRKIPLQAPPKTKRLPVVMQSGKDGLFEKMKGRVAGANAYVTKPVDTFTLLRTVRKHLGLG